MSNLPLPFELGNSEPSPSPSARADAEPSRSVRAAVTPGPHPPRSRRQPAPFEVTRMSDVIPESVEWLWEGRIPRGKLTILDGDPGLGKSTLTCHIAACLSTGNPPEGQTAGVRCGVLLFNCEDGLSDTLQPRLTAAGADQSQVYTIRDPMQLPGDIARMERAAVERGVGLIVIDPLMAYLSPGTNSHKDQDIRRVLSRLGDMAERTRIAVVLVRHLNKQPGVSAMYRGGGSIGIIGAARSGLLVAADRENPKTDRVLASLKSNLGPAPAALRFRIEPGENGAGRIMWLGECDWSADALTAPPERMESPRALGTAMAFLRARLQAGPVLTKELIAVAESEGISFPTLKRAKDVLKVRADRSGSAWCWRLPEAESPKPSGREVVP